MMNQGKLKNLENSLKEIKIEVSRFSNSWNVLLPILYFIYYNPNYINNINAIRSYLIRVTLFTYFKSGTTGKLQQMKSNINNFDYEITLEMLEQMNDLRVTDAKVDDIINSEKGSRVAGEALYYLSNNWLNKNFRYEQDHLHPESRFHESQPYGVTMEEWKHWRQTRNRLPNLHLLEGRSNGSKNNMRLVDYYNDMNDEQKEVFHSQAIIPSSDIVSLEFEDYINFYEERKRLLTTKIKELLG